MLFHHDSRNYEQAASEAAAKARGIMEQQIERGRDNAMRVIEQVQDAVPKDIIVPGPRLQFAPVGEGVEVSISNGKTGSGLAREHFGVHKHALAQFATRAGMPMQYISKLNDEKAPWAAELIAHNFNELYSKGPASKKRYLTRSLNGEVRGFLSDKYRRLDSRPLLEAFTGAMQKFGAVPVEGYALATKVGIKALLPYVFEPVPNEVFSYGLYWENSDYGDGAHSIRGFINRLWCTNMAITGETLRQVHVGKRLAEDFAFSTKTYELDTKAAASAIEDIATHLLEPANVHSVCAAIKNAHEEKVSPGQVASFLKKHLRKGEAKEVEQVFNSADIINVPPGQSKWRLSNAISWVAGQTDDKHRAIDLMKVAGKAVA